MIGGKESALPAFALAQRKQKKRDNAKFKMMRALGLQILEEDRQRCRTTLRTFNLTENVSTVPSTFAPPWAETEEDRREERQRRFREAMGWENPGGL